LNRDNIYARKPTAPLKPPLHLLLSLALIAPIAVPLAAESLGLSQALVAQARPAATSGRSAWPVALPAAATVRLKRGGSLSGRLVNLTVSSVTLAAGQQSQKVAMAQVSTIEFIQPQELWVTLPNGRQQQARPIRGLSLPIDPLPSSAIQVDGARDAAIVNLTTVFTEEQFAKLSRNPDVVYVLNLLEVEPDGLLALRVRPYGLQ
jgi:hypothetical protein